MPRPRAKVLVPVLAIALAALAALAFFAARRPAPMNEADREKTAYELYRGYAREFPTVEDIAPKALMALDNPVIVDARSPKERAVSMIERAIPEEEFLKNPEAYAGRPVAAYCTIGYRSAEFAREMAKRGIAVKNLQAGVLGWLFAGGAIVGPDGKPTNVVDVYGEKWNLAPDGIKTVW